MARLVKSVAARTDDFRKIDEEYAYAVWVIEREFNVGQITKDFLAMKFWNLLDRKNADRYNKAVNPKGKGSGNHKTMG